MATEGSCSYFIEGLKAPARFSASDVVVANWKHSLILASAPALIDGAVTIEVKRDADGASRIGDGSNFEMLGGKVDVDARRRDLLLDIFTVAPPRATSEAQG